MNRRNFFKRTLGVIGGVIAAFAPSKARATMYVLPKKKDVDKFSKTWIASKKDIAAFGRGDCKYLERKKREFELWQINRAVCPHRYYIKMGL